MVTGGDYSHPVARFGKVVLGKIPKPQTKIQKRWVRGVWLGKLDRDDSHILGTSSGAICPPASSGKPDRQQDACTRFPPEPSPDGLIGSSGNACIGDDHPAPRNGCGDGAAGVGAVDGFAAMPAGSSASSSDGTVALPIGLLRGQ